MDLQNPIQNLQKLFLASNFAKSFFFNFFQSKKPRIPLTSFFLMEALNGIHYSIFNGYADLGLRALDAVHNRAQYELYGDVLLITNALHDSLQQNQSIRMMLEIEPGILRQQKKTAAET
jgi:hypothetical protein